MTPDPRSMNFDRCNADRTAHTDTLSSLEMAATLYPFRYRSLATLHSGSGGVPANFAAARAPSCGE